MTPDEQARASVSDTVGHAQDERSGAGGSEEPRRAKRVLVFNQFAVPASVGGGTRHIELFGRLAGWEPTILAGNRHYLDQSPVQSEGDLKTVQVTKFTGNGASRVLNWASYSVTSFAAALRLPRPDVVYGSSPHLGAALAALAVARVRRCQFVLEVRDLWPRILVETGALAEESRAYRLLCWVERLLYRSASRIIILAEGSGDHIRAVGVPDAKLTFIPNGADPADFSPSRSREELRSRYAFTQFTVIYAGAHGPANGLDVVLDAASELAESGEAVTFVLVGDGVEKAKLVERARRDCIESVRFLDPVPKSEMPDLLAAADVGLHTLSDLDLFKAAVSPNKVYDYMAAGIPTLTNVGGYVADLVTGAGAGLAVPTNKVADGVRSLRDASAEEFLAFGSSAQQFMIAERSRSAMADRLGELLSEVVQ